jgi:hypothetical protein
MPDGASEFERHQIESLLQSEQRLIERGLGLSLLPAGPDFDYMHKTAILPAMRECGLDAARRFCAFDSDSELAKVTQWVQIAEVIIADVTAENAEVMYALGLCHGLRRCPILVTQTPDIVPFNLFALRRIEYVNDQNGLLKLRENLTRAIRVFLAASRASDKGT